MLIAGSRQEEIELARTAVASGRIRKEFALSRVEEARRIHAENVVKAKASVEKSRQRAKYATSDLENTRLLFDEKLVSRQQLDKAVNEAAVTAREFEQTSADLKIILADDLTELKSSLAVASREVDEAEAKLKIVLAGSRPEEVEAVQAEISNQEAQQRHIQEQLKLVTVISPISGVIATQKLKEKLGQFVTKGDLIATVHAIKTVTAEIQSSEKEIADVQVGQRVLLKARAFPQMDFQGTVTSIAPVAVKDEQALAERTLLVACSIKNPGMLKPGMTGKAKIFCGKRPIIETLTRRLARYIRIEFWSWW
jgi:multidrug resistance efflux pump